MATGTPDYGTPYPEIVRHATQNGATGSVTIYTVTTDKKFYMTQASISNGQDASSFGFANINGTIKTVATEILHAGSASGGPSVQEAVTFVPPIGPFDSATTIQLQYTGSDTGAAEREGVIVGYEIDA